MIDDHRSVHLVHGPGNDGMLLCLQVVKSALLSGSNVFWIGDLPAASAKSVLGSVNEEFLSRLLVGSNEAIESDSMILRTADLVIMWPWCTNHGRAGKSEISRLRGILDSTNGRVVAASLGNQDASGGGGITARSRSMLEEMGLETWFLSRQDTGFRRVLKSPDREVELERRDGEFSVVSTS